MPESGLHIASAIALLVYSATSAAQLQQGGNVDKPGSGPVDSQAQLPSNESPGTPIPSPAAESSSTTPADAIPVQVAKPVGETTDKTPQSRNRVVEEIVVTAQKREEAIQDVPISIAAFSAEALDARGAFDTKALASITPGLTITEFGGFSFYYIRGVGGDAFVPSADPSVTTYVDGIFVPTSQGFSTDFGGIERVEVLKGPQGTLFGRNSTGGAINVITKKPGGQFEGNIEGTVGNYNDRRLKAYVNVPVTDTIAFSLDGIIKNFDSQYTDTSRELLGTANREGRAKLHWQALDALDFTLTADFTRQHDSGSSVSKNIRPSPLFAAVEGGPQPDNYVTSTDFPGVTFGYARTISATVDWNLPWFEFKTIGASQVLHQSYTSYDFDGTALPLIAFDTYGQFSKAKNLEVQFLSRPDGWLGKKFEWAAGAYLLNGSGGFPEIYLRPGPDLVPSLLNGTLPLPQPLLSALSPFLSPLVNASEPDVEARGAVGTRSRAGYAQVTWNTTDWLKLTLGGRYTAERRYLLYSNTSVFLPSTNSTHDQHALPVGTTIPVFNFPLPSSTNNNFSSHAVISVIPREGSLIYVSRSTGFKSATYNVINIYLPPDYVKPEEVTTYELGEKTDFLGGALRLNAAVFDNLIKNKQAGFVGLISGGAVTLLNADKSHVKGAEFDVSLLPLPVSDSGLAITANGAYLDSKYDNYTGGNGYDQTTGIYLGGQNFSGHRIERTPHWSGGTGISQEVDAGASGQVEVGADAYYSSKFFFSAEQKSDYAQYHYYILNGRVSYLFNPLDLRFTLYGKNLTDERYHTSLFQTDFGTLSTLAYARQFGFTVNWKF